MPFLQTTLLTLTGLLFVCPSPKPAPVKHLAGLYTGPYFAPQSVGNISIIVGKTAHLPCRVRQVGLSTVSWVRNRDSSILSIEEDKVVTDPRFFTVKDEARGEWTLVIRNVTSGDSGSYECQISTQSKMSHFVYLKVLVPSVSIEGAPDIFAKSGSTVELSCRVREPGSSHNNSIHWLKEGEVISGWPDVKEREKKDNGEIVSILTFTNLDHKRLGVYSCQPEGLLGARVNLHVLDAVEQGLRTNSGTRLRGARHFSIHLLAASFSSFIFTVI